MEEVKNRKVFISFLGTNNYVETIYKFPDGEESKPVRFVQEALISHYCKDWTENDKIFIFCTEGATKANWLDNGQIQIKEDIEKVGLETRLKSCLPLYDKIVEKVPIKEGFSVDEIWSIFDTVYGKLQLKGEICDDIFFDVTHAFRSIPLFSTVLFNYSRFMKHTNVVSIKYGAFEKLGPAFEVRKMKVEDRIAPVLDLTNVVRLQQFTDMANSLKTYGRFNKISQILSSENENPELTKCLTEMTEAVEGFDNDLLSNRMADIKSGRNIIKIFNNIKAVKKLNLPNPICNVIDEMKSDLTKFGFVKMVSNENIEAAIRWAKTFKMLPQAYTLGQEYIISLLSEKYISYMPKKHKSNNKNKKEFREFLSSLCSISQEDVDSQNIRGILLDNKDLTMSLLQDSSIMEMRQVFPLLGQKRNSVNHGKGDTSYEDLVKDFDVLYNKCLIIAKAPLEYFEKSGDEDVCKSSILVNLSNHPSAAWSEEQKKGFESIVDIPFPQVDPDGDFEYIEKLADEYLQKVLEVGRDASVHIMGEFNFCYCLINKLKELGIRCLASCTKRDTVEENGVKISKFKFVQFREY